MIRLSDAAALLAVLLLQGGCEEMSRRTVYRAPAQDAGRVAQAAEGALPPDCAPACKPPKFCDRTLKPPKCVVAVGSPGVAAPESLHINYIDRAPLAGEVVPSDDEDPAALAN